MNWIDIVILVVIAVPALVGLKMGLIKILLSLAGVLLGIIVAARFQEPLAARLTFISQPILANVVAFVIILIATMLIVSLVARLLHTVTSAILLGWLDHLGGALFGVVWGIAIGGVALALWTRFAGGGVVAGSALAYPLLDVFRVLVALLPGAGGLRDFFLR